MTSTPYIGFDLESKLIAAHVVGKRDGETTTTFIDQIRRRVPHRIQLYTDGFKHYPEAIEGIYGHRIDFAQVIKPVPPDPAHGRPGHLDIRERCGRPDPKRIGTSYVERNNLTIRQQLRRFTRQTLGFSKRLTYLRAAVSIYVAWYDLCRTHGTLRMTPAMELGDRRLVLAAGAVAAVRFCHAVRGTIDIGVDAPDNTLRRPNANENWRT